MTDIAPVSGVRRDGGGGSIVQSRAQAIAAGLYVGGVTAYGQDMVNTEGTKATYSGSGIGLVPVGTSPTDIITLSPGAKTVRVTRFAISGTGTAIALPVSALLRSTLTVIGSATLATTTALALANPHDSINVAATATIAAYTTANPTTGTLVGSIRSAILGVAATTVGVINGQIVWDFTTRNGQGIVLPANSTRQFCINLNATTATLSLAYDIEWTEE